VRKIDRFSNAKTFYSRLLSGCLLYVTVCTSARTEIHAHTFSSLSPDEKKFSQFSRLSFPLVPAQSLASVLFWLSTPLPESRVSGSHNHISTTLCGVFRTIMEQKPRAKVPAAKAQAAGGSGGSVASTSGSGRLGWRGSSYNTEIEICMVLRYAKFNFIRPSKILYAEI